MKKTTRLAAALFAASILATQIPESADAALYTILNSYNANRVPTGTSYLPLTYYNQYVDAGSVDASPFVLTRTTTANDDGILFYSKTELISGADANTFRLTSTTGAFDFTSFNLIDLEDQGLPMDGFDPAPTNVPTMTITSSLGPTQTFSASVNAREVDPTNSPGYYRYRYDGFSGSGTQTLNWSGVDWVDFTSQYTKAQITTLVLTTAAPAPAPIPEPGTWAAMAIFAGGAAFAGWRRRKSAKIPA
jgi:hypothetical protein